MWREIINKKFGIELELKHFQLQKQVPEGRKGNILALSKRESGIFFVYYQHSCFLSTAVGREVGNFARQSFL
jgi:hypothetical protein